MNGIDIDRIKRWFVETHPAYSGTKYKIIITALDQISIDAVHDLAGVELGFTVAAYDTDNNTVVNASITGGVYTRWYYSGWQVNVTA